MLRKHHDASIARGKSILASIAQRIKWLLVPPADVRWRKERLCCSGGDAGERQIHVSGRWDRARHLWMLSAPKPPEQGSSRPPLRKWHAAGLSRQLVGQLGSGTQKTSQNSFWEPQKCPHAPPAHQWCEERLIAPGEGLSGIPQLGTLGKALATQSPPPVPGSLQHWPPLGWPSLYFKACQMFNPPEHSVIIWLRQGADGVVRLLWPQ